MKAVAVATSTKIKIVFLIFWVFKIKIKKAWDLEKRPPGNSEERMERIVLYSERSKRNIHKVKLKKTEMQVACSEMSYIFLLIPLAGIFLTQIKKRCLYIL